MTYNVFSGTLNPTHFTSLYLWIKFDICCFKAVAVTAVSHSCAE